MPQIQYRRKRAGFSQCVSISEQRGESIVDKMLFCQVKSLGNEQVIKVSQEQTPLMRQPFVKAEHAVDL